MTNNLTLYAVMWEIGDPSYPYGLSRLYVFPAEKKQDLVIHIAMMTGEGGLYRPSSAEIIGMKEYPNKFIPDFMKNLQNRYELSGTWTDIGLTTPMLGHMEIQDNNLAKQILQGENFKTLENYVSVP